MEQFSNIYFKVLCFALQLEFISTSGKSTSSHRMMAIQDARNKILADICGRNPLWNATEVELSSCHQSLESSSSNKNRDLGSQKVSNAALRLTNRRSRMHRSISYNYCKGSPDEKRCCVRSFYVDFKEDLGWNWVHAPSGLHLNTCSGGCHQDWGATSSHASLMSRLAKLKGLPDLAPKCVPRHYQPITILYYENENPTLRKIDEIIVTECKCT